MSDNFLKSIVAFLIVILSVSCTTIEKSKDIVRDRKNDYQVEETVPRLILPEHISEAKISDFYEVPETKYHVLISGTELAPPGARRWEVEKQSRRGQSLKSLILKRQLQTMPKTDVSFESTSAKPEQYQALPGMQNFTADMPTMTINSDFNQVWDAMDEALRVAGYPVVGKVKDLKIFFIVDAPADGGVVRRETPIYQLNFIPQKSTTIVYVTNNDGKQLSNHATKRVLKDLNLGMQGKRRVSLWRWFMDL